MNSVNSVKIQARISDFGFRICCLLFFLAFACHSLASTGDALNNYKRGRFAKARTEFERLAGKSPDDARLRYNAGAAAFQDSDYESALRNFSASLSAPDVNLQQSSYYNLGNTQFRLGEKASDPKEKQQAWEQSVHDYENAVKLKPQDADAKFNLDVVKQKLEELKKQQEQQKQNQDNKDDKKDDQDKKDQDKQDQKKQDQQKQDKKDQQDKKDEQKKDQQDQQQKSDQEKKDEQKKQEEAKKQEQAKGDDKKPQDQMKPQDQRGQEPDKAAQAAQYSKVMQMTPQQAMQLMEAQKAEEKAMIFVPQNLRTNKNSNRLFKDW